MCHGQRMEKKNKERSKESQNGRRYGSHRVTTVHCVLGLTRIGKRIDPNMRVSKQVVR